MKLKVTQIRSTIGRKEDQKRTITALGLGKIRRTKIHDDNSVIRGMINKVSHLLSVEELEEDMISDKKKESVSSQNEKDTEIEQASSEDNVASNINDSTKETTEQDNSEVIDKE